VGDIKYFSNRASLHKRKFGAIVLVRLPQKSGYFTGNTSNYFATTLQYMPVFFGKDNGNT